MRCCEGSRIVFAKFEPLYFAKLLVVVVAVSTLLKYLRGQTITFQSVTQSIVIIAGTIVICYLVAALWRKLRNA